jgi:hypothetical protein
MYDLPEAELLYLLSDRAGIAADYHDIAGTRHVTTDETRRAILSAMGFRVADRSALIEELTAWITAVGAGLRPGPVWSEPAKLLDGVACALSPRMTVSFTSVGWFRRTRRKTR